MQSATFQSQWNNSSAQKTVAGEGGLCGISDSAQLLVTYYNAETGCRWHIKLLFRDVVCFSFSICMELRIY